MKLWLRAAEAFLFTILLVRCQIDPTPVRWLPWVWILCWRAINTSLDVWYWWRWDEREKIRHWTRERAGRERDKVNKLSGAFEKLSHLLLPSFLPAALIKRPRTDSGATCNVGSDDIPGIKHDLNSQVRRRMHQWLSSDCKKHIGHVGDKSGAILGWKADTLAGVRGSWCGRKGIKETEGNMVRKKHGDGRSPDTGCCHSWSRYVKTKVLSWAWVSQRESG